MGPHSHRIIHGLPLPPPCFVRNASANRGDTGRPLCGEGMEHTFVAQRFGLRNGAGRRAAPGRIGGGGRAMNPLGLNRGDCEEPELMLTRAMETNVITQSQPGNETDCFEISPETTDE